MNRHSLGWKELNSSKKEIHPAAFAVLFVSFIVGMMSIGESFLFLLGY